MFCPTALSMTNLKLHKKLAMDNTFTQEKLLHRLTFNPGLALTGFRTTWPRPLNHGGLPCGKKYLPIVISEFFPS